MKIIQRGNCTIILDPDEETCDQFEEIMFAGVRGFMSADAILQGRKAESQPQQPEEPPQTPGHA